MLQKTTKVITASGKRVPKSSCCTIDGEFYIKNEEAVKVGLTWFRLDDPRIFFDYSTNSWRKTRGVNICKGVVGYNGSKKIMGSFEVNHERNICVNELNAQGIASTRVIYMDKALLKDCVVFNKNLGVWEDRSKVSSEIERIDSIFASSKGIGKYDYSFSQEYSSSKHMDMFTRVKRNVQDLPFKTNINKSDLEQFGPYSFGLEFETSMGKISQADCFSYGLIPLRDGSIKGIEYTTIPMSGEEGFKLLINQIKLLQNSAEFDRDCSLHVHLGGFPVDSRQIWALYKLLVIIEPKIAEIMPKYAFKTSMFKSKGKDYCLPLRKFGSFEDYYCYCSGDRMRFDGNLKYPHPLDQEDRAKWNIHARYVWANLINMLFKPTGKTVEFRVHAPTFNIQKIINWLFICSGILQYAIKNKASLLSCRMTTTTITLEDLIVDVYSGRVRDQLLDYVKLRKALFNILSYKYEDNAGILDLKQDSIEDFKTNLITSLK